MESQPRNPEFRNNPENVHPCNSHILSDNLFKPARRVISKEEMKEMAKK